MGAIGLPFMVGAKVGDAGFDLDDMDRAVVRQRDDVRAPAREERKLRHGREPEPAQHAPRATGHEQRCVGLAPVLERFHLEGCGVNETRHGFGQAWAVGRL
jgi:PAB1-binding protein PBP1